MDIVMLNCKLMDLTGPLNYPLNVAVATNSSMGRIQVAELNLTIDNPLGRTTGGFDDDLLIPFEQQSGLQLAMNDVAPAGSPVAGKDLGLANIDTTTINQVKTTRFYSEGNPGPFYELTYKVLPG